MTLYFAYGSNLNKEQMSYRCPQATPVGTMILPRARLLFRGVADIIHDPDCEVHGGLWTITPDCEAALDRYEGVKHGLYRKLYLRIRHSRLGDQNVLTYQMQRPKRGHDWIGMPPIEYYESIEQGYHDFGLDLQHLRDAVIYTAQKSEETI